jgi:hypothetical protein
MTVHHIITLAAQNETVETDETSETIFFICRRVNQLGYPKKREIFQIAEKCYFFIHLPISE